MLDTIPGIRTDLVEVRLDYFPDVESLEPAFLKECRDRLILTIRDPREGGKNHVDTKKKERFLRTAIEDGFLVDVEISNLNSMSLDYSNQILSRHYLIEDPTYEELESLVKEYSNKCRFLKIALRRNENSARKLISLLNRHHNLVVMEVDGDPASRIVYSLLGSKLIYCHVGEKTSPGQISCQDAARIFGLLEKLK